MRAGAPATLWAQPPPDGFDPRAYVCGRVWADSDDGVRQLGDALANGAAPALKKLLLGGKSASDAAKQAVQDALKNRK